MSFADNYFKRHFFILPKLYEPPSGLLYFIVVIPVYLEENLWKTLRSIRRCELPKHAIEVILVFNYSIAETQVNKLRMEQEYVSTEKWCRENSQDLLRFIPFLVSDLPGKHAGAGLARKIGMDAALKRFGQVNKPHGIILSLDADTVVDLNYFKVIEEQMITGKESGGCILHFEHPLSGNEYNENIYRAIIQYELHLRYYRHMLGYSGFPYSNYTIGSCFGVRAHVYARHGGMNRQKAGEDFYFLNKFFPHIHFTNIRSTCVHPSPRPSDRVPFGTGPVIQQLIERPETEYLTYSPHAFFSLQKLFTTVPDLYSATNLMPFMAGLEEYLRDFLHRISFEEKLTEIRRNTSGRESFTKRFFLWFNAFMIVKYLNFVHTDGFQKIPVREAVTEILKALDIKLSRYEAQNLLEFFRDIDRNGSTLKSRSF
jgi:hypothetical protein